MAAEVAVYQLGIVLREVDPTVWRRVLVRSDTSLAALHLIVQAAMGWDDVHLHQFRIHGCLFGICKEGGISFRNDPWKVRLADFRLRLGERFVYEYDFGDFWQHDLRLEKVLPLDLKKTYPVCSAGEHACPPEDCGGPDAYREACLERYSMEASDDEYLVFQTLLRLRDELNPAERFWANDAVQDALDRMKYRLKFDPDNFDRKLVNQRLREVKREVQGAGGRG